MEKAKIKPSCLKCGGPLEERKFVDSWDTRTGEPSDISEDLYCPKCDLRWEAEEGPHDFLETWKPEEHRKEAEHEEAQ